MPSEKGKTGKGGCYIDQCDSGEKGKMKGKDKNTKANDNKKGDKNDSKDAKNKQQDGKDSNSAPKIQLTDPVYLKYIQITEEVRNDLVDEIVSSLKKNLVPTQWKTSIESEGNLVLGISFEKSDPLLLFGIIERNHLLRLPGLDNRRGLELVRVFQDCALHKRLDDEGDKWILFTLDTNWRITMAKWCRPYRLSNFPFNFQGQTGLLGQIKRRSLEVWLRAIEEVEFELIVEYYLDGVREEHRPEVVEWFKSKRGEGDDLIQA